MELVRDRLTREPDAAIASWLINELRRRRILISGSGPHANVLKIRHPLVFSLENADLFIQTVDDVFSRR